MATRKAARETLAAVLIPYMTTCEEVNDYYKSDPAGKSPVLCIHSLSTMSQALSFQGNWATYGFDIIKYVRRSGEGITEATAEDTLDEVSQQLYEAVEANDCNAIWQSLTYSEPSIAIPVNFGGIPYWMEVTSLAMEMTSSG